MAASMSPYLSFDGDARAAMEFYREVFGGELRLTTFGEFGVEGPDAGRVMHSQLDTPAGDTLMGSDVMGHMTFTPGNTMTVALFGDDADELRARFARLADGGTVETPLEKQVWGDEYGACTDRFGTPWMVNISAG
jgi:PhnB protein